MVYPHEVDERGVVVRKNPNADNQAGKPEEVQAVTGRPNDLKQDEVAPALPNSTFASRAKEQQKAARKAVAEEGAENKAVKSRRTK